MAAGVDPLVVSFGEDGADETGRGGLVGEMPAMLVRRWT